MADTIKSSSELKLVWGFYDDDDRTLSLQNPRADLTASEVKVVSALAVSSQPIIGDKAGAAVVGLKSANKKTKIVKKLDLAAV